MASIVGFAAALLAILVVPGPTNTLLATSGATVGLARSLPLLVCELIGYEAAIAVIRLLMVPVLARSCSSRRYDRAAAPQAGRPHRVTGSMLRRKNLRLGVWPGGIPSTTSALFAVGRPQSRLRFGQ